MTGVQTCALPIFKLFESEDNRLFIRQKGLFIMFVEINNLVKIYGKGDVETRVIDNLSVSLEKGELCTLLGASGSGKSTLLNTLGGLEKTEGGSIFVEGQEITKLKASQLTEYRRQSLGFVFQFYNLIGDLSVKENIEVGANISKKVADRKSVV